MLYKIMENDLYYVLSLAVICVAAFNLGLLIGWLMLL